MHAKARKVLPISLFILMAALTKDKTPEPGGVFGGPYLKWGQPPFVERSASPPPGGAFQGVPLR